MKVSNLARVLLTSKRHRSQRRDSSILIRSLHELQLKDSAKSFKNRS
ncbi:MAG: hypothetical protein QNJ38_22145 [Prochloraceae cyanobacterium]|nr:hypothetical protein [Prochloraceae cyanobacterium]